MEQRTVLTAPRSVENEKLLTVDKATAEDFAQWQELADSQVRRHLNNPSDTTEARELGDLMQWEFDHIAEVCDDRTLVSDRSTKAYRRSTFILRSAEDLNKLSEVFTIITVDGEFQKGECELAGRSVKDTASRVIVEDGAVSYEQRQYQYMGDDDYRYVWKPAPIQKIQAIHDRFSTAVTDALIARTERTQEENAKADERARYMQICLGHEGLIRSL